MENLRQFIQRGFAQEFSHSRDVLLRILKLMGGDIMGGAHLHSAEFENLKVGFVQPYPLLPEENRARVINFDCNGKKQIQRR